MIAQGLHKKMSINYICGYTAVYSIIYPYSMFIVHILQWFERCKQLWIQCGPKWDEQLLNLSENFFDTLMVSYKAAC